MGWPQARGTGTFGSRLHHRRVVGCTEGEIERCASLHRALGPDLAPVAVNDTLHSGELDAGAFKVRLSVQTLESYKKLLRVRRIETRPAVPHEIDLGLLLLSGTELNPRRGVLARVLPGIAEQILQRYPELVEGRSAPFFANLIALRIGESCNVEGLGLVIEAGDEDYLIAAQ